MVLRNKQPRQGKTIDRVFGELVCPPASTPVEAVDSAGDWLVVSGKHQITRPSSCETPRSIATKPAPLHFN